MPDILTTPNVTFSSTSVMQGDWLVLHFSGFGSNTHVLNEGIGEWDLKNPSIVTKNFSGSLGTTSLDFKLLPSNTIITADITVIPNTTKLYTTTVDRPHTHKEGTTKTIKVATSNVPDGDILDFAILGSSTLTSARFIGGLTSGQVTIVNNSASLDIGLVTNNDIEAAESYQVVFSVNSTEVCRSPVIGVVDLNNPIYFNKTNCVLTNDCNHVLHEGQSVTFTLTTTGLPDGSTTPYTAFGLGLLKADITSNGNGVFTIQNNTASVTYTISEDCIAEGVETLTLQLLDVPEVLNTLNIAQSYAWGADPKVYFDNYINLVNSTINITFRNYGANTSVTNGIHIWNLPTTGDSLTVQRSTTDILAGSTEFEFMFHPSGKTAIVPYTAVAIVDSNTPVVSLNTKTVPQDSYHQVLFSNFGDDTEVSSNMGVVKLSNPRTTTLNSYSTAVGDHTVEFTFKPSGRKASLTYAYSYVAQYTGHRPVVTTPKPVVHPGEPLTLTFSNYGENIQALSRFGVIDLPEGLATYSVTSTDFTKNTLQDPGFKFYPSNEGAGLNLLISSDPEITITPNLHVGDPAALTIVYVGSDTSIETIYTYNATPPLNDGSGVYPVTNGSIVSIPTLAGNSGYNQLQITCKPSNTVIYLDYVVKLVPTITVEPLDAWGNLYFTVNNLNQSTSVNFEFPVGRQNNINLGLYSNSFGLSAAEYAPLALGDMVPVSFTFAPSGKVVTIPVTIS